MTFMKTSKPNTMKSFFTFLIVSAFLGTAEAASPTLDESIQLIEKALPENLASFVNLVSVTPCPALVTKGNAELKDARLPSLTEAILKKVSSVEVNWTDPDKEVPKQMIGNLVKLRNWVLTGHHYGNILITSACDFQIGQSLIVGIKESKISALEVKVYTDELNNVQVPLVDSIEALSREVPNSAKMTELLNMVRRNETDDLLRMGRLISEEQKQELFVRPNELLPRANVGAVILLHASASGYVAAARALAEYVLRGGALTLDAAALKADLKQRIPELFQQKVPAMGREMDPSALVMLITDAPRKR